VCVAAHLISRLVQITGLQTHKRNEYILMLLKNNSMARCVLIAADELGVPLLDAAHQSSPRRRPAEVAVPTRFPR
jgi:hypothetical protein